MHGVDNGFILFNNFRIPRLNLLNRFSDVTEDGKFKTQIESADQRFALQLGALATGRIMVLISSTTAIEMAVKIAIRFAAMRQQFGKPNEPEMFLIEYPLHQQRLFPILAKTLTYKIVCQKVIQMWGKKQKHLFTPNNAKLAELHALISVMKVMSSNESYDDIK